MRAIMALLLLAAAAPAAEDWAFLFANGDRLRCSFAAMRNGAVLLGIPAAEHEVTVPFASISSARPAPAEGAAARPALQLLRLRDGGAILGWCRAIRQGNLEFEGEALGILAIRGNDVAEVLPAEDAVRSYQRSLAAAPADVALDPERFDAVWTLLGSADGNVAWQAHRDLARAGDGAVALLAVRLEFQPDAPDAIKGWIRSLAAESAEVRTLAHARLRALGKAAEPCLKAALRDVESAEARRRIAALLAALAEADPPPPDPETVRFVRAIRVLEEIGTADAQAALARLAKGAPEAPTGKEAQAAIERLRRLR